MCVPHTDAAADTVRSALVGVVGTVVAVVGFGAFTAVGLIVQDVPTDPGAPTADPTGAAMTGVSFAVYLVAALGALAVTGEYSTGTIKPSPGGRTAPLRAGTTEPRVAELAHALGYWAARWASLPGPGLLDGRLPASAALDGVPGLATSGGIRTRLAAVQTAPQWPPALHRLAPVESTDSVPRALDDLTDAAVSRYRRWAHGNPVMLVHAATAPRAAALVLPVLPRSLWMPTYATAWTVSAAITAAYRPAQDHPTDATPNPDEPEPVSAAAVANHDEHVIKVTEVAVESHRRGSREALPAAARAAALVTPNW